MVYRIFVEKKSGFTHEADTLFSDLKSFLCINSVEKVRLINRYDVENIAEELFEQCRNTVFSEPQTDNTYNELEDDGSYTFAVEYLPGQFDQRADSCAQCIQIISQGEMPSVRTAKVYKIYGNLSQSDREHIEKYVINPVECRKASLEPVKTLKIDYPIPEIVKVLDGFCAYTPEQLGEFIDKYGLAMDKDDIAFCQQYFRSEKRDPTITEIRMIDTYWSDHCRHTTFLTTIDSVEFEDALIEKTYKDYMSARKSLGRTKPVNLMDIATLAVKVLKKEGKLDKLDESEEINACTVKIKVNVDGKDEDWLLLFKNETHNHPTEIEPFGGAATCIGGAIRDPLSGRSYVYGAMRVTGAGNPLTPIEKTLPGKLPQRKIVTTAAAGYSSYGNQIGLSTGQVDEIYHDGYTAKRMEIGAVIAAAPAENVRRERPNPGDIVILLGGRTGRDGCGGATGSSKSHTSKSLESCGAEVQKGNAPEERKLQRLFRNKKASQLIKRCNDFGAGGVSVAIGELADGLEINLNAVPKKYDGLDGTELAISESQERMAVVVDPKDSDEFIRLANSENLEATVVAYVTESPRLVMNWNGNKIVDISREFLNSNGAEKHISVKASKPQNFNKAIPDDFEKAYTELVNDLNVCSKRGLSERFDSTIGAGSVVMPFGGKYQLTPSQCMINKISTEKAHTDDCSLMSYGFNPFISEKSPYHGAYLAVVESVSKLIASGAKFNDVYLTFQEYFEKPHKDPSRWGKPFSALLGAYRAQTELGIAAIGGKDSMSGSFEHIDVPPTLVSFAVTTSRASATVTPEFKKHDSRVVMLSPEYGTDGLPKAHSLIELFDKVHELTSSGKVLSCYTPTYGGAAEAIFKMCLGNGLGFDFENGISEKDLFGYSYGTFILELADNAEVDGALNLGKTTQDKHISKNGVKISMEKLISDYENKLESVYPTHAAQECGKITKFEYPAHTRKAPKIGFSRPHALIPVFPGTNCEYDTAKALSDGGNEAEIFVINNLSSDGIAESVKLFAEKLKNAQIVVIPGGFSGGDEPDGSGKFITAFFRNAAVKEQTTELLENRDGLMCGICNGFQALIKLGLVPFGKITDMDETCPTLTFNSIARHQSKLVRTRVASNKSPWLSRTKPGEIYTVPISHGEGRFIASDELIKALADNGQIATQYADLSGEPTYDIRYNPNNSYFAVEGITSPDGRVLGKMGHSERIGQNLYMNVPGEYDMQLFAAAADYYKI